jgi:hypothetical protein
MTYCQRRLDSAYRHVLAAKRSGSDAMYCVETLRSPLLAAKAAREAAREAALAFVGLDATERNILRASTYTPTTFGGLHGSLPEKPTLNKKEIST